MYLNIVKKLQCFYDVHEKKKQICGEIFYRKKNGSEKLRTLNKIGETRWNSKNIVLLAIFYSLTK